MTARPTTFAEILELQPHGPDTWVGLSPDQGWTRVYGGQVVAQALWAAIQTVDEEFFPHSLHAYFIRGGDPEEPIRYEVDRLRNGRSFCTRTTVARQSGGAILQLSCSFQRFEEEADVQIARMPPAPAPEEMNPQDTGWVSVMERRTMGTYPGGGQSMGWVQLVDGLDDDPRKHICGLAFTSDTVQFPSARSLHPDHVPEGDHRDAFIGASLDHAMWFHRPQRADEWHLFSWECQGLIGARGITVGNLFARDGTHIASIAQELLQRKRRPPDERS